VSGFVWHRTFIFSADSMPLADTNVSSDTNVQSISSPLFDLIRTDAID
jgi:hypothetical protein